MSDQPNITPATPTPPTAQSLDDILNQLEKATGTTPGSSAPTTPAPTPATMPEPSATEAPPVPAEAAPVMPAEPESVAPVVPETPAIDPATSSEPMTVVEPAPATPEPEVVVSEPAPTMAPEPEVVSEPAPSMTEASSQASEPTPVATLEENDIPAPPPAAASEPAPMVKEEPGIDVGAALPPTEIAPVGETPTSYTSEPMPSIPPVEPTETPQQETMPDQPIPEATPSEAPKSSGGNSGKIMAGVIGVLLLVGAVGAGVFLTQQNQETRTPATTTRPVAQTEALPVVTPVPAALKGTVSGKICNPGNGGTAFFYNTKDYEVSFVRIAANQSTYTNKLVFNAPYLAFYQPEGSTTKYGYTGTDKKLKTFTVTDTQPLTIDLCDGSMDVSSVPTEQFTLGE